MITLTDDLETNIETIIMDSVKKSLRGSVDGKAMRESKAEFDTEFPEIVSLENAYNLEYPYSDYKENIFFVNMLENYIDGRVEERPVTTTIIQRETRVLDSNARARIAMIDDNIVRKATYLAIPGGVLMVLSSLDQAGFYAGVVLAGIPAAFYFARLMGYLHDWCDIQHDKQVREILQTDQTLWDTTLAKIKPEIGQLLQERYENI